MPRVNIVRQTNIIKTPRVMQLEGLFDIPPAKRAREEWQVDLPLNERDWNVGLIVGPSGAGKSTIAKELFGDAVCEGFDWDHDKAIIDSFPVDMSIHDIVYLLSSVGFSSPPSWLKPYRVLSTGEKMRVDVARLLASGQEIVVMDEFTSVVDRVVAQVGSAAVSKAVRKRGQKFVAVTCHYDVIEWLQPDWIYQPHTNEFLWRFPEKRPEIKLNIYQTNVDAWGLFKKHHYLSGNLNKAARCFVAYWNADPVAFVAVLHFPHPKAKRMKREHRLVCLPEFQGVGIGMAVSEEVARYYKEHGFRYFSVSSHPGVIAHRNRSKLWRPMRKGIQVGNKVAVKGFLSGAWGKAHTNKRRTMSFEFVG